MIGDLRQTRAGVFERDPLSCSSAQPTKRQRVLRAWVGARRAGDHELANRLLGELVDLNEAEKKEIENG